VARYGAAEFTMGRHVVTVEQGTTIEEIQNPAFWAHVSSRFQPYDEITARVDDGLWYAKLLVLVPGRNWAKVKLLHKWELSTSDVEQTAAAVADGYEIKMRGPHLKWCVIRNSDQQAVKEGCGTRVEAQAWLDEHLKVSP
jgi:hypothetical protein